MRGTKAMPRKDAFRRAMESYLDEVAVTRSAKTLKTYRTVLTQLHKAVLAAGVTTYIRRWELEDALKVLAQRAHLLPSTYRLDATVLRRMLLHSGLDVLDRAMRTGRVKLPPKSRVHVRWYSESRLAEIRASCRSDAEYVMVVLASEVGLRRAEIARLRVEDIRGDTLVVRGKGGKVMPVPLTPPMAAMLDSWMVVRRAIVQAALARDPTVRVPPEVLLWRSGARVSAYTPETITTVMSRVGRRVGIRLSPHDCRRSCGRELYLATKDIGAVNRLLRHEQLDQTREYIGADIEDARAAMEARERARVRSMPSIAPETTMPVRPSV